MTIIDYGEIFHIEINPKHRQFSNQVLAIRSINRSVRYLPDLKVWEVPGAFRRSVETISIKFKAGWRDPFVESPDYAPSELPELDIELFLKHELRPYQGRGAAQLMAFKKSFCGDEQGLGKTIQSIAALIGLEIKGVDVFPVVIICPSAAKENWRREWNTWTNKRAMVLKDSVVNSWGHYYRLGMAEVFITNYENAVKYFVKKMPPKGELRQSGEIILKDDCELIKSAIYDESHRLKDVKTITTKVCMRIAHKKEVRLLLTGTPIKNRVIDIYSQLCILGQHHHFGGTEANFKRRYCGDEANLKELNFLLNKHCFFRREKKEVAKDLPDKQRQKYICDISNRDEYDHAERKFKQWLKENANSEGQIENKLKAQALTKMQELSRISARGKLHEVKEYVNEIVDGGEKVLLFCELTEIVDKLKVMYPKAVCITGAQNDKQKQASIDAFQNNPGVQICIGNIQAAGTAITLTAASRVGFVQFPWTAADCVQCEDRTHRIGQKNAVMATYFLGNNTIDERRYEVVLSKNDISNQVTGGTDDMDMQIVDRLFTLFNQPKEKDAATDHTIGGELDSATDQSTITGIRNAEGTLGTPPGYAAELF